MPKYEVELKRVETTITVGYMEIEADSMEVAEMKAQDVLDQGDPDDFILWHDDLLEQDVSDFTEIECLEEMEEDE
jgi:hypothetical protein